MATSSIGKTSFLIALILARFKATSALSNLGHKIPGVSKSKIFSLVLSQTRFLVTPGILPTLATFLPASLFINVDFPTFGTPTTKALISFSFKPLLTLFSLISRAKVFVASKTFL